MRALVFVGLLAFLSRTSLADHCPVEKVARGKPETSLAGVDLVRDKLGAVLTKLGAPARHEQGTGADSPPGSGWAYYEWTRGSTTIAVSSEFYTSASGERVESIEVVHLSGRPSGQLEGTSRGLRLGDRIERVVKLYGDKYVDGTLNGPTLGERTVTYCFVDESELSVGFDRDGRVVHIRLAPSAE